MTTHRIIKIEFGILQQCKRDLIVSADLRKPGLLKWDQVDIKTSDGIFTHSFGVWHRSASTYITLVLNAGSPLWQFNGLGTPLDRKAGWTCPRCCLCNAGTFPNCVGCLIPRPSQKQATQAPLKTGNVLSAPLPPMPSEEPPTLDPEGDFWSKKKPAHEESNPGLFGGRTDEDELTASALAEGTYARTFKHIYLWPKARMLLLLT